MRELNSKAEWCGGIAGGIASFRGKALAQPAGGTCFSDDDHVIFQLCDGNGCRGVLWNVRDDSHSDVLLHGISVLSGDGGVWAAMCDDGVVHDSLGRSFPGAAISPSSVGPDGDIAIKNSYQSYGPWTVHRKDGSKWFLQPGTNETQADGSDQDHDINDLCLLGNGRASFTIHGEPQVAGAVPLVDPVTRPFWWLRLIETPLGWFALYQESHGGRLVLHKVGTRFGYVVAQGQTFEPDARCLGNEVWIRYSVSAGEPPSDLVVLPIDLTTPMVDLVTLVAAPIPPAPIVNPVPPIVNPTPQPEKPSMSVPNRADEAKQIASNFNLQDNSVENCARVLNAIIEQFHKDDPRFGYVSKAPGEMNFGGFSQDSAAFNDGGNIVSVKMISGAGDSGHGIDLVWVVGGALRDTDHWAYPGTSFQPVSNDPPSGSGTTPTPEPAPASSDVVDEVKSDTDRIIAAIKVASDAEIAKLEEMRQDFIKFGKMVQQYAPALLGALAAGGGGLSGLLGSLTKKSS